MLLGLNSALADLITKKEEKINNETIDNFFVFIGYIDLYIIYRKNYSTI